MIDSPNPSAAHVGSWPLAGVLVVDDEPGMRNFLEKTLRTRVGHVQGAGSAEEADEQVRRHRFDESGDRFIAEARVTAPEVTVPVLLPGDSFEVPPRPVA